MLLLSDYDREYEWDVIVVRTPPMFPWAGLASAPPVIPKLYWDAYSDEQRLKELWRCFDKLADWSNMTFEEIIKTLSELYEYAHGTAWEDEICKWINENLPCIIAQTCKWFHFGINENGNVVCTIPLTWDNFDISWNMDFDSPDFGRLTIGWK